MSNILSQDFNYYQQQLQAIRRKLANQQLSLLDNESPSTDTPERHNTLKEISKRLIAIRKRDFVCNASPDISASYA